MTLRTIFDDVFYCENTDDLLRLIQQGRWTSTQPAKYPCFVKLLNDHSCEFVPDWRYAPEDLPVPPEGTLVEVNVALPCGVGVRETGEVLEAATKGIVVNKITITELLFRDARRGGIWSDFDLLKVPVSIDVPYLESTNMFSFVGAVNFNLPGGRFVQREVFFKCKYTPDGGFRGGIARVTDDSPSVVNSTFTDVKLHIEGLTKN